MEHTAEIGVSTISHCTLIVGDQEESLQFYTEKLGFEKIEDIPMGDDRWLTVAPSGEAQPRLILRSPDWFGGVDEQRYSGLIGHNPMLGLKVEDCRKAYDELTARGVNFSSEPEETSNGVEAVLEDNEQNQLLLFEEVTKK
ncbi:VOC family protein [Haloarchaeobius amylolyticus]|uniref:VOC family protein n=1 Tax=Haloarchaeobius amylolyticus TaxID=1198296 RepID=UPI00226D8FA6|nr:VOC family protein [Haloarchaeobius amylolyticus]